MHQFLALRDISGPISNRQESLFTGERQAYTFEGKSMAVGAFLVVRGYGVYRHSPGTASCFGVLFALIALCATGTVADAGVQGRLAPPNSHVSSAPESTSSNTSARTVDVRGEGDAHAPPDTMFVSIQVEMNCRREDECFKLISARADEIAAVEKAKLGPGAEISTGSIGVNPIFGAASPAATPTPAAEVWKFTENVKATADSIELIGALIDAGIAAGASDSVGSGFDFAGAPPPSYAFGTVRSRGRAVVPAPRQSPHPPWPMVILPVETEAKTADEAVKRGSEKAERVRRVLADKLGGHGTVTMDHYMIDKIPPQNYAYRPPPPQQQVQRGFSASITVEVETREPEKLASIAEASAAAGATRINQVRYSLSDQSAARKDAIEHACADAQQKAESAAHSLGVKLGKISKINVDTMVQGDNRPGFALAGSVATRAEFVRQSVPHLPANVHASVSVTYLLE